jgi:hypothetical protein
MPCKACIHSPGALHHIIARGIERKKIFRDGVFRTFDLNFIKQIDMKNVRSPNAVAPLNAMSGKMI